MFDNLMVPLLLCAQTGTEDESVPVGLSVTLIVILAVLVHPLAPVAVTVYVFAFTADGNAITVEPVLIERSPGGLHE